MAATPTQAPPTVTREPPPRRNWLILGAAAVLLIVVAGAVGWWIGSSSDDGTSAHTEMPQVVEQYYDAMADGDSSALAALFTEDGVLEGVTEDHARSPLPGPAKIKSLMNVWLGYVDYTDMEILDVIAEGNTVVVVSRSSGMSSTHDRAFDKTPFSAPVVEVFTLDNGLIARCDVYYEYDEVVN